MLGIRMRHSADVKGAQVERHLIGRDLPGVQKSRFWQPGPEPRAGAVDRGHRLWPTDQRQRNPLELGQGLNQRADAFVHRQGVQSAYITDHISVLRPAHLLACAVLIRQILEACQPDAIMSHCDAPGVCAALN